MKPHRTPTCERQQGKHLSRNIYKKKKKSNASVTFCYNVIKKIENIMSKLPSLASAKLCRDVQAAETVFAVMCDIIRKPKANKKKAAQLKKKRRRAEKFHLR